MHQTDWAEESARKLLEIPLPRRWAHTQGVAARARSLVPILDVRAELVEAAAWLHDVGYSPDLVDSGFHPLDGARYLRDAEHADDMLCRLVAHHSGAASEASERGLRSVLLREFPAPPGDLADALTYSDMTTGPAGDCLTVHERLTEIGTRYGSGHVVTRSLQRSSASLVMAADRVQQRMSELACV
jgi:hypothetical protein